MAKTLFDTITATAARAPARRALVWFAEDGSRQELTIADLHRRAMAAAGGLHATGLVPEDLVLIALPYSLEIVTTFLGAAYGAATPAIVAYAGADVDAYAARVRRLADESQCAAVVCSSQVAEALRGDAGLAWRLIPVDDLSRDRGGGWSSPPSVGPESIAVVQFTSGTTGTQKGVQVSQRAMVDFLAALSAYLKPRPDDVVVSWLPLYHDMGLLTGLLLPLVDELLTVLLSPAYWVRSPAVMLKAVSEFRGTLAWMPNFALNHIARSVRERDLEGLDLSSWRLIANGAEPVRREPLRAFVAKLARCGLREEVVQTGYGMAENVLTATIGAPRYDWISLAELQQRGRAVPAEAEAPGSILFVGNGTPLPPAEIAIVDSEARHLGEREIGEIIVRSPYLFSGYRARPDLTAAALHDGWFHSGDLGYLADGHLYICGRKKDLIIVGGANIHPEDVEAIADSTPGVQPGRAVAFGVFDEDLGTERVVLVCELREPLPEGGARTVDRTLRRRMTQELDVALGDVRFVARGWVLKTTSGKLARFANRDKYLNETTGEGGAR